MNRPWMPLYIADYLAGTAHLSAAEHGGYLLLIMHYWSKGKLLDDEESIRRITRMTPRQWSQSCDVLRSLFLPGWRHKRIDEELAKAVEKSRVNSANASKRHESRKADAERTDTHARASSQSQSEKEDTSSLRSEGALAQEKPAKRERAKARSALPEDWKPDQQDVEYAIGRGFTQLMIPLMANAFANHHRSKGNLMADWHAAWRTWVENEIKFNGGANGQRPHHAPRRSSGDDFLAGMRSVAADLIGDADSPRRTSGEVPLGRFNIDGRATRRD